jgi:hypothetical protein
LNIHESGCGLCSVSVEGSADRLCRLEWQSDVLHKLLPPPTDGSALSRLAQERHARGIYARLRSREDALGPHARAHGGLVAPGSFASSSARYDGHTDTTGSRTGSKLSVGAGGLKQPLSHLTNYYSPRGAVPSSALHPQPLPPPGEGADMFPEYQYRYAAATRVDHGATQRVVRMQYGECSDSGWCSCSVVSVTSAL